jgi:hypothetical protein
MIVPQRNTVTIPNDDSIFTEMTALSLNIGAAALRISSSVDGFMLVG